MKSTAKEIFKKVCVECNIRDCSARFESCMIIAMKEYANQQQPSRKRIQTEVKDILECIVKFDKTATVKEKARYFDVIQKNLEDCQPEQDVDTLIDKEMITLIKEKKSN